MLQTPLKHAVAAHAPAQHPMAATRCSPHNPQPHELNLADWLHMSPAQVAMMSPAAAASPAMHYTPPNQLYVQNQNPMQYGGRNDFIMAASPLPYSSPYAHSYQQMPTSNSNFPLQVPIISVESAQHTSPYQPQYQQHSSLTSPSDASLLLSFAEYFSYTSQSNASSPSPVAHRAEAESTPVTTLSGEDESQGHATVENSQKQLIDMLRAASPETNSGHASNRQSPMAPAKMQSKPVESIESPFRIAQPQPRNFTPVDTSSLSELAEVASRQSTPSQLLSRPVSRPSSALSTHSHAKPPKAARKLPLPPRRFEPSPLHVNLPHLLMQLTPSFADALVEHQRGPLEFEKDGHRYRTRSKLKSLKAEIQEREREADLTLIRRGLKGPIEEVSSLELLASVSATRRLHSEEELLVAKASAKSKRGTKRSFRDVDTESVTSSGTSNEVRRTPSKRARTEKSALTQKVDEPPLSLRSRTRATRATREKDTPARPASMRVGSHKAKKGKISPGAKGREVDDDLSSLSSMSDMDYEPEMTKKSTPKPKAAPKPAAKPKSAPEGKLLPLDNTPIDIPVRFFPAGVPMHASFSLLYRRFPLCAFLDPQNSLSIAPPGPLPGGHFNPPRSAEDLYTPRFVRGVGRDKAGLCPICYESRARGGAGKAEWLSMKFSAFNYHMQYAHGISPTTTQPFSPPIAFRTIDRKPNHKNEKLQLLEGQCHRCHEWTPVEGVKCVEAKLKEIYWWKHAAQCHKGSTIEGESGVHLEDDFATRAVAAYKLQQQQQASSPGSSTSSRSKSHVGSASQATPLFTTAPLH
ncbi:hypothetical protein M0805_000588 [Coniferiporia weirii]|nr:hypothetical protein M0805_000588 [Coniferiporia weirii]